MKFIEPFISWKTILESLAVLEEQLLSSVDAKELDFSSYFGDVDRSTLEFIIDNETFLTHLNMGGYRKSEIIYSDDYETFLIEPLKLITIHRDDSTDLEDPEMIIIQIFNSNANKWGACMLYRIQRPFKHFYNSLTTQSISIVHSDQNYVYRTSNVNEWELVDPSLANDTFPDIIRREDLLKLIQDLGKHITIKL